MSTPIHVRQYQCEAFAEDDGRLRVRGRLTDDKPQGLGLADGEPLTIHDMVVELYLTMPGFVIDEVEVAMQVHPYEICPSIVDHYQQLVGVSIARGYARRVRELFGGPGGCSHVGALLLAMGPVAIQASWSLVSLHDDLSGWASESLEPAERERRTRLNTNTCHVWQEGGEHLTALTLGETRRPGWERERLTKLGYNAD